MNTLHCVDSKKINWIMLGLYVNNNSDNSEKHQKFFVLLNVWNEFLSSKDRNDPEFHNIMPMISYFISSNIPLNIVYLLRFV